MIEQMEIYQVRNLRMMETTYIQCDQPSEILVDNNAKGMNST